MSRKAGSTRRSPITTAPCTATANSLRQARRWRAPRRHGSGKYNKNKQAEAAARAAAEEAQRKAAAEARAAQSQPAEPAGPATQNTVAQTTGPQAVAVIPQPRPSPSIPPNIATKIATKLAPQIAAKPAAAAYAAVPLPRPKPPVTTLAATPAHADTAVPLPPPRRQALEHRQSREQRAAAHRHGSRVIREVWTDAHGRPLSAREVREIKRLLHESDSRSAGRGTRGDASFDKVWR